MSRAINIMHKNFLVLWIIIQVDHVPMFRGDYQLLIHWFRILQYIPNAVSKCSNHSWNKDSLSGNKCFAFVVWTFLAGLRAGRSHLIKIRSPLKTKISFAFVRDPKLPSCSRFTVLVLFILLTTKSASVVLFKLLTTKSASGQGDWPWYASDRRLLQSPSVPMETVRENPGSASLACRWQSAPFLLLLLHRWFYSSAWARVPQRMNLRV